MQFLRHPLEEVLSVVVLAIKLSIGNFDALLINGVQGVAILDARATQTVAGCLSVQPVADQCDKATIETTDVGFPFAGGETEAASSKVWIPHGEFAHGNYSECGAESVNTVSH